MVQSDGEFVLEIRNDDRTRLSLHNSEKFSIDAFNDWYYYEKPYWFIASYKNERFGYFRTNYAEPDTSRSIQIGMDIHPNFRGRGLATLSFLKFFELLSGKGYRTVWLEVLEDNVIAYSLYLKLRFKETNRTKRYDQKISITMTREL